MSEPAAVIVAARRTAIGRVGGLHRSRRLGDLAEPVIRTALADAGCVPAQVAGLILGCSTEGAPAARTVGLAAGLPESSYASVIDSQCASGLDAIVTAVGRVTAGQADCLVAGGAESVSTAPWRVSRPRSSFQAPNFIGFRMPGSDGGSGAEPFEADEELANQLGLTRRALDEYVLRSHICATLARGRRQFSGEIAAARATPEEMRDQMPDDLDIEDLGMEASFRGDDGLLTPANTSALADGAAFAVVVSAALWAKLGRPAGLVLAASHRCGIAARDTAHGGSIALGALLTGATARPRRLAAVETSEVSAAEAIALVQSAGLTEGSLNAGGGALDRGHPLGAASAVAFVRLFSRLLREQKGEGIAGAVTQRTATGTAMAAIFNSVAG